jgi:hypothetical protein
MGGLVQKYTLNFNSIIPCKWYLRRKVSLTTQRQGLPGKKKTGTMGA